MLSVSEWYEAWAIERPRMCAFVERPSVATNGTLTRYYPDAAMKASLTSDATLRIAAQDATSDLNHYTSPWPNHA